MPKLLRIFVPLGILALLVTASASTAPLPTGPNNGGYFGNAPHSPNYEWVSSTRAGPNIDATSAGAAVSDAAFTGNYYIMGSYDARRSTTSRTRRPRC